MSASGHAARDHDSDAPFFLAGNQIGCLLLHGLGASARDMRFIGDQLHARGWSVSAIHIAGHARPLDEFARSTRQDWYASAHEALMDLRQHAARIVPIGQSMGALLALRLAAEHPDSVAAVGVLAPALLLSRRWLQWIAPALPLLSRFKRYRSVVRESDIADAQVRAANLRKPMPVHAIHELLQLQREVRALLPRIRQPVMVLQSRQDHTVPLSSIEILRRGLGGRLDAVILEQSYHVLSIDVEKERIARELAAFIERTVSDEARNASRG